MGAVLLGVFKDYESAHGVRVNLVRDGFPTDRVELTATCHPGRAGYFPAPEPHGKFEQNNHKKHKTEADRQNTEKQTKLIKGGAATVTVHPRGAIETSRAT